MRASSTAGAATLGDQVLVERPRGCRRAPLQRLSRDAHDKKMASRCSGSCNHVAEPHVAARFPRALTIDPDLPRLDQLGGKRPRLHEPCAPEPFVEPLSFHLKRQLPSGRRAARLRRSSASTAKGELSGARGRSFHSRRGMGSRWRGARDWRSRRRGLPFA